MSKNDKESKAPIYVGTSAPSTSTSKSIAGMIVGVLQLLLCIYALYLVFKCNGGFLGFLAACCCPIIYVPYKLSKKC